MIGTRPEAIKMAPVAGALRARGMNPLLVFTGQQPLDAADYRIDDYPALHLGCPGRADPDAHVRSVVAALLPKLARPPQLLLVQGDTSSALGGAVAAVLADVSLGHVEAGLRTHDPRLPWPEEAYRTAIDAEADLLFAPTGLASENLRQEQVGGEIYVTGNTGIDALLRAEGALPARHLNEGAAPRLLVTCHRRESWGDGLASIASALRQIADSRRVQIDFLLHPNPHVAATMRKLLEGTAGIALFAPCSHMDLLRRVRDADLVLSDSGGIQEEAPVLGTPLLVLREKTERPEGVASGNARLVGTDTQRIVAEVMSLLDDPAALAAMSRRCFPYGDGTAAPRIASIIASWLGQQRPADRPQMPAYQA